MAKQEPLTPVVDLEVKPRRPATDADMPPLFERLATNKDVDVEKLKALLDMHERVLDRNAKAAFDAAFSEMQPEIPEIDEKGAIRNREGEIQSRYARNEDIQKVLRPILKTHGFSLSFRTEWPSDKTVKVVGILAHRQGYSRESEFLSAADSSGNKNAIQALGSSVSYGRRYTTMDLLNITSRNADDDGQASTLKDAPAAPDGFDDWLTCLEDAARQGQREYAKAWNDARPDYRQHLVTHHKPTWDRIKAISKGRTA